MVDYVKIQAYQIAMAQARVLLHTGIIDHADFMLIEDVLAGKYGLKQGSLYRENDLISDPFRANMV